jgi:site-specific DNA-methyltransferase (adenine-specific)
VTLPTPYYADAHVSLYHGDCLDLLQHVGEVDHVLTDAPYSDRVVTGARTRGKAHHDHSAGEGGTAFVPFAVEAGRLRAAIDMANARRWTVAFCDLKHAALLEIDEPTNHAHVRTGVWNKPDGAPQFTGDRPAQGWEAIGIFHHRDVRKRWNGAGRRGVWTHPVEREVPGHPTPKPLPLMRELVRLFTDPGDLILDCFAGSGTTGLAARLEGRRAILIEREERYCAVAARRLEHMPSETGTGQLSLLAGGER